MRQVARFLLCLHNHESIACSWKEIKSAVLIQDNGFWSIDKFIDCPRRMHYRYKLGQYLLTHLWKNASSSFLSTTLLHWHLQKTLKTTRVPRYVTIAAITTRMGHPVQLPRSVTVVFWHPLYQPIINYLKTHQPFSVQGRQEQKNRGINESDFFSSSPPFLNVESAVWVILWL